MQPFFCLLLFTCSCNPGLFLLEDLEVREETLEQFIARVEETPLRDSQGGRMERVLRNEEGEIVRMKFSGMQLTSTDFLAISRISTLKGLDFYQTNITNDDLQKLKELPQLQGLVLNSTEITDAGISVLPKFKALRSLCLSDVKVSRQAIDRLVEEYALQNRSLGIGFRPRN